MIQICKRDNEKILKAIRNGSIDAADISFPNLIDTIVLSMKKNDILSSLANAIEDKRAENKHIPFYILLVLAITAKLKLKTSLTDVPFAITDAELLAELGWNIWDNEREINKGLFSESVMRKLVAKYSSEEWIRFYNRYVQEFLLKKTGFCPDIHILDCTKIPVNLQNENYEEASVVKIDGKTIRGYKLGVLRGVLDDAGIAEEIVLGTLKTHDLELCRQMLKETSCLKEGDILINDRGFLSREMVNYLKTERNVDSYLPAKENMILFQDAVRLAVSCGKWKKHPNRKRAHQRIQLLSGLGPLWESSRIQEDVPINACVVQDTKTEEFFVFMTTDTDKTARQIIQIYELRPEIEEDFRQMKDFWKLSEFNSTKYNYISFHIVMTLIGYLYFQIFKNLEEGAVYRRKSLPVVLKNHKEEKPKSIIIYSGQYFGIFPFLEFLQIYAECTKEIRHSLDSVLIQV